MSENKNKFKVPSEVKEFAKASYKKYKKHNDFDSKKEAMKSFNLYLMDMLPEVIEPMVKYGYLIKREEPEIHNAVLNKFCNEDFIKSVKKELKRGNKIKNIKLFPIIIGEMIETINSQNAQILSENPNATVYTGSDLIELGQMILSKKIKKFTKAGIDENIAFDVLSIIPTDSCLEKSYNFRIASFEKVLYEHSKAKVIPFAEIMNLLVDKEWYAPFIKFFLCERKEVFGHLTDNQKAFYLSVSNWCFDTLESLDRISIERILDTIIQARKIDESKGKDSPRRYSLTSLSETDYPRIFKMVQKKVSESEVNKKYLS